MIRKMRNDENLSTAIPNTFTPVAAYRIILTYDFPSLFRFK